MNIESAGEAILLRLQQTAVWRRGLAGRFLDDPRNNRAAERLDALAQSDLTNVDVALWDRLIPYFGTAALREAVSEASRDIEFRRRPKDLAEFLKLVIEKFPAPPLH